MVYSSFSVSSSSSSLSGGCFDVGRGTPKTKTKQNKTKEVGRWLKHCSEHFEDIYKGMKLALLLMTASKKEGRGDKSSKNNTPSCSYRAPDVRTMYCELVCAPGDLRTQADAYLQLQHNCNTIEYSRKIISFVFLLKWCRKIATRIIM